MRQASEPAPPGDAQVIVDCEAGRCLGCATFCCRLIVRLDPEERVAAPGYPTLKSCVDKDPRDGLCVHLDRDTHRCRIWERRPRICREYNCNTDPLLQIVLQRGFTSLTDLVQARADPAQPRRFVPCRRLDAVQGDAVQGDAVQGDAVQGDAVQGDAVQGGAVQGDDSG